MAEASFASDNMASLSGVRSDGNHHGHSQAYSSLGNVGIGLGIDQSISHASDLALGQYDIVEQVEQSVNSEVCI